MKKWLEETHVDPFEDTGHHDSLTPRERVLVAVVLALVLLALVGVNVWVGRVSR